MINKLTISMIMIMMTRTKYVAKHCFIVYIVCKHREGE